MRRELKGTISLVLDDTDASLLQQIRSRGETRAAAVRRGIRLLAGIQQRWPDADEREAIFGPWIEDAIRSRPPRPRT